MMTLTAAAEAFIASRNAASTRGQYRLVLAPLIAFLGGDLPLTAITGDQLAVYMARLKSEPSKRGIRRASTIKNHTQIIKAAFHYAVSQGWVEGSPADRLKSPRVSNDTGNRAIPENELQAMIEFYRWDSPRNYALMLFLADTGCRATGAASLQRSRLDLGQHTAVIVEKGDKEATVYFGALAAAALRAWLTVRPAAVHDYVWTAQGPDYKPLQARGVGKVVTWAAEKTSASRIWGPHSIRHYVGHKLAKAGVPVTTIQKKLNHSSPDITMKAYLQLGDAYLREISDSLALKPAPVQPSGQKIIRADFRRLG